MMLGPVQRKDLKWEFAALLQVPTPVGYCVGPRGVNVEGPERMRVLLHRHAIKFHTTGHDAAREAEICYRTYLLDFSFRLIEDESRARTCTVCGEFTQRIATVGIEKPLYWAFPLCYEHADPLQVAQLIEIHCR